MHPNTYLRTFWRSEFRPEVFVAMSFAGAYEARFRDVIEPAIHGVTNAGRKLRANRVDLSRSGDSILSDIADGICHSELVLADVSTLGHDSKSGDSYRNGNVMYEVGLALASRQPSEVLLIRDDQDRFLFDLSAVPHKFVDFTDTDTAIEEVRVALEERISERKIVNDARVLIAVATLTGQERQLLEGFAQYNMNQTFWLKKTNLAVLSAVPRLLDKGLIVATGITQDDQAMFRWTNLGYAVAMNIASLVPRLDVPARRAPSFGALLISGRPVSNRRPSAWEESAAPRWATVSPEEWSFWRF
jgi:hypothetical protein